MNRIRQKETFLTNRLKKNWCIRKMSKKSAREKFCPIDHRLNEKYLRAD